LALQIPRGWAFLLYASIDSSIKLLRLLEGLKFVHLADIHAELFEDRLCSPGLGTMRILPPETPSTSLISAMGIPVLVK